MGKKKRSPITAGAIAERIEATLAARGLRPTADTVALGTLGDLIFAQLHAIRESVQAIELSGCPSFKAPTGVKGPARHNRS